MAECCGPYSKWRDAKHGIGNFTAARLLPKTYSEMRASRMNRRTVLGLAFLFAMLGFCRASFAAPPSVRETLAEFETGATQPVHCKADDLVGAHQEISRFQILPALWQRYSTSGNYGDPETAWSVAEQILDEREQTFRRATGREWNAVDIYLMWNAPGAYRRADWDRARLSDVLLERAQRFANLLEARGRLTVAATPSSFKQ
jgi:hypothetical protein